MRICKGFSRTSLQLLILALFVLKQSRCASIPLNDIGNRAEFNKACNAYKFSPDQTADESNSILSQLQQGGSALIPDGDHFCGSAPIQLRVLNATGASRRGTRVWGVLDLGQAGELRTTACCWESRDGYRATLALLPGASWVLADCEALNGGGVGIECTEAALTAARCCVGGFGTGPRPSASAGVLVWGRGGRVSRADFADCAFQHTVAHAARYASPGAAGRIVGCTLRNCGRGVAAATPAGVHVE
jgi:hypothetical protein